jgi:hypothetical protein
VTITVIRPVIPLLLEDPPPHPASPQNPRAIANFGIRPMIVSFSASLVQAGTPCMTRRRMGRSGFFKIVAWQGAQAVSTT